MENVLNFENRNLLYQDLISRLNFKKIDEKYYKDYFGDFFIVLSSDIILLRFINERSFLTIKMASKFDVTKWFDLSYVCELIFNTDIAIVYQKLTNEERIKKFNDFLLKNILTIENLFNKDNFKDTSELIDKISKRNFFKNF